MNLSLNLTGGKAVVEAGIIISYKQLKLPTGYFTEASIFDIRTKAA